MLLYTSKNGKCQPKVILLGISTITPLAVAICDITNMKWLTSGDTYVICTAWLASSIRASSFLTYLCHFPTSKLVLIYVKIVNI